MAEVAFKEILAGCTKEGELYSRIKENWVQCFACGHKCKIPPGKEGICKVRFNIGGKLFVPFGYVSGIALDPIEKKPFFHVLPGSAALSFGMLGCDYHCSFCQNWITSQTLRDPRAVSSIEKISSEEIVNIALSKKAPVITSTYNEPLITSEWSVEIFKRAKGYGILTSYVSNGNGNPQVLDYLEPWVDLFKIDLKSYSQKTYSQLGGLLQNVLDTIKYLHLRGKWIEVVTLIVPGMNDSDEELTDMAKFICSVSPDIPWHVTAYHQDYKMNAKEDFTPTAALIRAAEIGYKEGLHYVYTGNLPGQTRNYENTYCCSCNELLIQRQGFRVISNKISDGRCVRCRAEIPGKWRI
ncbi:MAG: AmmeMemoRadiSam system radical SAM enzyme [Bacteroidetes bacterium]|nr:AmmeMemoRadiSam system radical SAM enzyme [Bacteroidota bacterium]